jgi:hypothetical protein
MPRTDLTPEQAAGMLKAIQSQHTCAEACTAKVTLGDGKVVQLTCPWTRLDVNSYVDRGVIATVYADMALAAMAGPMRVGR